MADFFVRLRGREHPFARLALSQDVQEELSEIFSQGARRLLDEDLERIPLDGSSYTPDETEVWAVDPFELSEDFERAIEHPIEIPALEEVEGVLPNIKCIVASLNGDDLAPDCIAFQAFDRRQFLTRKGVSVVLSGEVFRRLDEPGINIGSDVHAVYRDGALLFRSEHFARRVVDIKPHFSDATDQDVEEFVESDTISIEDEERFRQQADQHMRRRLARINESGVLDTHSPGQVQEEAEVYGIDVEVDESGEGNVLVVPDDKQETKALLKFLEEEYYQGPLTRRRYITNSKRPLPGSD